MGQRSKEAQFAPMVVLDNGRYVGDDAKDGRGVYVRRSQIAAALVLALLLATAVGLMAGLLPECDIGSPSQESTTPAVKPTMSTTLPMVTSGSPVEPVEPTTMEPEPPATTPTEPPCNEPWCNLRLPTEIQPEHYALTLYPNLDTGNFSGSVDVDIVVGTGDPITYPRIHYKKMVIESSTITPIGSVDPLSVVRNFYYPEYEFFVMEMETPLALGKYVWSLTFSGSLDGDIVGLYMSSYTNSAGNVRKMATSKFEPTDARSAFPCFDEPNMKAEYTTTLIHPPAPYYALSNMDVNTTTDYGTDGTKQTTFRRSVKMSTYLACFVVCDFGYKEKLLDSGKPFRVYAPPDQIDQVDFALNIGVNITDYYEEYFDLEYPLPKLDMIAIPNFISGAMEHWGLITYRETNLLFSETESAETNKQRIADVVAHELAHQWFGNIVTMDWWDDLWLNEGFASYVEYIGVDHIFPEWQKMDQFLNQDFFYVMKKDQIVSSHPIIVPVNHPDEINEIFDSIPYRKGASVLRMLNELVSEEVFKTGVNAYLKKYNYSTAVSDDLWAEITQASNAQGDNIDVKTIMDTWTLQMGFPVVTMTKNEADPSNIVVDAAQEWFLVDPEADKSKDVYGSIFNYTWNIRFNYYFGSDANNIIEAPMELGGVSFPWVGDSNNNWYLANVGHYGYYRVNYDANNWQLLSQQLMNDHKVIAIRDRAGLLDDAFNLAKAELIDYKVPLDMTKYLDMEEEYTPWNDAYGNIIWLREMLRYSLSFGKLRKYFAEQAAPMLEELKFVDEGSHLEIYLRGNIIYLSCGFGDRTCLDEAVTLFRTYLNGSSIPVNLRYQVYRFGMEEIGDQDAWEYMWNDYLASDVSTVKATLRYGMAKTRQPWLLSRYLEYCKTPTILDQDFFSVVSTIADNPVGNRIAWDWVRANYDYILERFSVDNRYLGRMVPNIAEFWNTELQLQELQDFWAEYPDAGAGSRGRLQAIERIQTNIDWIANNEGPITDWLDAQT